MINVFAGKHDLLRIYQADDDCGAEGDERADAEHLRLGSEGVSQEDALGLTCQTNAGQTIT